MNDPLALSDSGRPIGRFLNWKPMHRTSPTPHAHTCTRWHATFPSPIFSRHTLSRFFHNGRLANRSSSVRNNWKIEREATKNIFRLARLRTTVKVLPSWPTVATAAGVSFKTHQRWKMNKSLTESNPVSCQFGNRAAAFRDNRNRAALRIHPMRIGIDSQKLKDRGREILRANGVGCDAPASGICRTNNLPVLQTAARHHQGHHVRPMIAAGLLVDHRGAAKLAHH